MFVHKDLRRIRRYSQLSILNQPKHTSHLQGSTDRRPLGLVNFVPALAYLFCLNLPAASTQLWARLLVELCTSSYPYLTQVPGESRLVMISEAILEPPGTMEVVGWLVDSVKRCGGVVEIPLLGSSPLIKSREAKEGELFTATPAVSVPCLHNKA